ncbi:Crp/Fnr family transcriptional regulator [uncultured Roseovarius sp.]|uniref:Crp/Fnr family transcriptional regulator n=1 Tax=uncultured Roseovarius sp. TaxID=293344 RepID=UPI00261A1795|nr:Crp/Fnr family transcriptional regulator [uncultured Roseovarius sp.]
MPIKCQHCPLRKKSLFDEMTSDEVRFMQTFKSGELRVEAGTTLMMEGSNSPQLFTVLEGMGLRYKTLEDGDRQVINFILPGDFLGLQAGVMQEMQHTVEASTDMLLCVFDRKSLWNLFEHHAERAFDLTWLAAVEEHLLGESLAILGQMSGIERVARAFVRLNDRCDALDLKKGAFIPLPFRQQDLADALGLSLVHTNKTLKKLRDQSVANWANGKLEVINYDRLCDIAQLDPTRDPIIRPLL